MCLCAGEAQRVRCVIWNEHEGMTVTSNMVPTYISNKSSCYWSIMRRLKNLNHSNVPLNHFVSFHVAQEHLIILHLLCFCDPSSHPDLGFRFCSMKKTKTFHIHVFYFSHIFCLSLSGSWEGCWFIAGALGEHLGVWSSWVFCPTDQATTTLY